MRRLLAVWGLLPWFALAILPGACSPPVEPEPPTAAGRSAEEGLVGTPGRWRRADGLDEQQQRALSELEAIGYAAGSEPAPAHVGVTVHEPQGTAEGLSFYTSGHGPEALLIDMRGAVRHRWRLAAREIWPDAGEALLQEGAQNWRRAHLFEDGDVIAIFAGLGIARLTRDSDLVWSLRGRVHHDLDIAPDGTLWTLSRRLGLRPEVHESKPIVDDTVLVLSPAGEVLREFSLIDAFRGTEFEQVAFKHRHGDLFHTNSIEVLDGRLAERVPEFRAGNLLISLREVDLLAVVDPEAERVVWGHQGRFRQQHDPQVLADGNLILFDNQGLAEDSSRILVLDVLTGKRVWALGKRQGVPFSSLTCGTVARLSNGNTLVTESDGGRAFEVTPEFELVWEFRSPHRAGANQEFVATLFDLVRLPPGFADAWLD